MLLYRYTICAALWGCVLIPALGGDPTAAMSQANFSKALQEPLMPTTGNKHKRLSDGAKLACALMNDHGNVTGARTANGWVSRDRLISREKSAIEMPLTSQTEAVRRYKVVSEQKANGETYTPKILADFVAKQIAE